MSKQRVFLLCTCILLSVGLSAQVRGIDQGFGLAFDQSNVRGHAIRSINGVNHMSDFSLRLRRYGITYLLRKDLVGGKAASLSLGSAITAGYGNTRRYHSVDITGSTTTTVEDKKGTHIAFDIPVFLDLNLGLHSAREETRQAFGVYAGIGYAYSYTKLHTSLGLVTFDGFDPLVRLGFRMGKRWESRWGMALTARGGLASGSTRTYGVQLLKEL